MKKKIIYPFIATTVLATAAVSTTVIYAEDSTTVSTSAESNYQTLSKTLNDKAEKAKEDVKKSTAPQDDKDSINTAIDSLLDKAQAELKSASEADYDVNGKLKNAFDEGRKKLEREGKRAICIGKLLDAYNQVVAEAREQNVSVDELSDKDFSFEYYFGLVRTLPGSFDNDAYKAKDALDTFRKEKLGDTRSDSEQSSQASKSSESSESSTSTSSSTSVSDKQTSDKTDQSSPSETQTEATAGNTTAKGVSKTSDNSFDFSKLVGTWRNGEGRTITINADGTYSGDETGEVGTEGTRYNDTDIWSVGIRATNSNYSALLFYAPAGTSYPAVGQEKDASDISQDRFMMTNAYPEGTANTTYYHVAAESKPADKVGGQSGNADKPDNGKPGNGDGNNEGKIDGITDPTTPSQTAPSKPNN
ncbi:DUF6287 domain-containing protein [Streptococcus pluranimalium]|uniref:DUF6287 domain-containing protein n=1 Tax=Streptococcus pluranimalium TaxID=82348 RepID=UPI003F66239B